MVEAETLELSEGESVWVTAVKTTGGVETDFHYTWQISQNSDYCKLATNPDAPVATVTQIDRPGKVRMYAPLPRIKGRHETCSDGLTHFYTHTPRLRTSHVACGSP
eukprot:Blabericola_migrator_1__12228@NODE_760_length_6627_cov_45_648933_g83_i2_p9_GENE_NODE_760_length_6627_cov_45_648933_g83_i2NODE_760_length_6627_cov_45_648933_g83_i2_p9_ORF_typecomplete_len106_score14_86_NODE_760_length_6627_cov_45_648933_g83_i246174934